MTRKIRISLHRSRGFPFSSTARRASISVNGPVVFCSDIEDSILNDLDADLSAGRTDVDVLGEARDLTSVTHEAQGRIQRRCLCASTSPENAQHYTVP